MHRLDRQTLTLDGAQISQIDLPLVPLQQIAERLLGLTELERIYHAARPEIAEHGFFGAALRALDIDYDVADTDLERIPRQGATIVIANHPFGAVEGIILGHLLKRIRPDVKIMANTFLGRIAEMREHLILVDPFGTERSAPSNVRPLREATAWLRNGGLLVIFPAGEVASLSLRSGRVADPAWSGTLARLVRIAGAAVVPVHIDGRNDWLFQTAGLIHPRLRTVLLARALLGRRHRSIDIVIGKAIPFSGNTDGRDDDTMMRYLRARTFTLSARHAADDIVPGRLTWLRRRRQEIERADQPWVLGREVGALPDEQHLIDTDRYAVYWATATQIPRTLREIGRLREETFRAVGEGTGRALDLDRFDDHYLHLFLWDKARRAVVGAYRMGTVETILGRHGGCGLYTSTLFRYTPQVLERLKPALEIGRAFIRFEYQRGYSPLLLLWKGIGAFIAANPRYSLLFGPISVSGEYSPASRAAIQGFLTRTRMQPDLAEEVVARNPARERGLEMIAAEDRELLFRNLAEVNRTVSDIEEDGREIPVLLRQYLRLGARVLDFNVDRAFADAMDVLIMVDLRRTERSILRRYLGAEGAERFLAHHGAPVDRETDETMSPHDRHEEVPERCTEAAVN